MLALTNGAAYIERLRKFTAKYTKGEKAIKRLFRIK